MDRFGEVRSNPEGIQKIITINGTLKDFTDKFSGALRTAFSYANATYLNEFIGKVQWKIQSIDEFNSYNK